MIARYHTRADRPTFWRRPRALGPVLMQEDIFGRSMASAARSKLVTLRDDARVRPWAEPRGSRVAHGLGGLVATGLVAVGTHAGCGDGADIKPLMDQQHFAQAYAQSLCASLRH